MDKPGPGALPLEWPGRSRFDKEAVMVRKYVDCREMPQETRCTIAISADNDEELIDAAVQHAVAAHGHRDNMETRALMRQMIHQGTTV